jgi:hypothetical protein
MRVVAISASIIIKVSFVNYMGGACGEGDETSVAMEEPKKRAIP